MCAHVINFKMAAFAGILKIITRTNFMLMGFEDDICFKKSF